MNLEKQREPATDRQRSRSDRNRKRRLFPDDKEIDRPTIDCWIDQRAGKMRRSARSDRQPVNLTLSPQRLIDDAQCNTETRMAINVSAKRFFRAAIDWSTGHNTSVWFTCLPCGDFEPSPTLQIARLQAALARHLCERELDSRSFEPTARRNFVQQLLDTLPMGLLDVNARHPISGCTPFAVSRLRLSV